MCFKFASIKLFRWICENNYQNIVKMCVPVHDEFNLECPKEIAEEVTFEVKKISYMREILDETKCKKCKMCQILLNRNGFCKISRFIHIQSLTHGNIVSKQL